MLHRFLLNNIPLYRYLIQIAVFLSLCGCSAERFVPEGRTQLSTVKLTAEKGSGIKAADYRPYVRERENARWFNLLKVPLGIYCLSGRDTTAGFNRFVQRMGEPPALYDSTQTKASIYALTAAMQSRGFLHASTQSDTLQRGHKTAVSYHLTPGLRTYVRHFSSRFDNDTIARIVRADSASSLIYKGMPLDAGRLSAERSRIVSLLRASGYYHIHKEFISFRADTLAGDYGVHLTTEFNLPAEADSTQAYTAYRIGNVNVLEDINSADSASVTSYRGINIFYHDKLRILRRVYSSHIALRPGKTYSETDMQNTYRALNALPPVSYTALRFRPHPDGSPLLDCDIYVKRGKPHALSAEVEGTNTSGNLGAALAFTFTNRNLFGGAELLSLKLRGAYEAITGLEGYDGRNYTECSAEAGLRFPILLIPFVKMDTKQNLKATSELNVRYNMQDRPEFHRRLLNGTWSYAWTHSRFPRLRHRLDLFSLDYVFMPWISKTFREDYLEGDDPRYAVLRYSYENLFIMKLGYNFVYTSPGVNTTAGAMSGKGYRLRVAAETAGNTLFGLSKLLNMQRDENGRYTLFNIAYSQYAKFDFDFVYHHEINSLNAIALHAAIGAAIPYGNSSIVPYEKRYYAGGPNSVRGWGVRELGPGSFVGTDGKIDFVNQTGNLRLDLSVEYRTHLFWKIGGAAFIDAGNVWTTRNYSDNSGGLFRLNRFAEQIAVAYGLGLRLNLDYFVLRFDCGMKAINPAFSSGRNHYPLFHPNFNRDFAFHFAVGLPF